MEVFAASLLSTALVVPARPAIAAAPIMQFSTAPPVATARPGPLARAAAPIMQFRNPFGQKEEVAVAEEAEGSSSSDEEGWTLDKVAKLGLAGVLSIAVAESVFWILSFPISSIFYFFATGEWIDLFTQEGQVRAHTSVWGARRASPSPPPLAAQVKFLAFTAGWGALGGAIAQYRTVLTAAAITPWMDENVVKPYLAPFLDRQGSQE